MAALVMQVNGFKFQGKVYKYRGSGYPSYTFSQSFYTSLT